MKIKSYYPKHVTLPKRGEMRELVQPGSSGVAAIGKVVAVNKKARTAVMRVVIGGK